VDAQDSSLLVERAVADYQRGAYTLIETTARIMQCITRQNVDDILSSLPDDIFARLKSDADEAPTTDVEWANAKYIRMTGHSEKEEHTAIEDWKGMHRIRIEAIRRFDAERHKR
jgi:hypothetical protein